MGFSASLGSCEPAISPVKQTEAKSMNVRTVKPWSVLPLAALFTLCAHAQSPVPLTADTPEYKCFVDLADYSKTVIYFYDGGDLPDRFADEGNLTKAKIPNSVREEIRQFHECALRGLEFEDAVARSIEAQIPQ
jgi:hypothetical protein